MGKVEYKINIQVSIEEIYRYVKESVKDERYIKAAHCLVKCPAAEIVEEGTNKRITIREKMMVPIFNIDLGGWHIIYSFSILEDYLTEVTISIQYSLLMAFLGGGTVKYQASNQIVYMLNSLIAYEKGADDTRFKKYNI